MTKMPTNKKKQTLSTQGSTCTVNVTFTSSPSWYLPANFIMSEEGYTKEIHKNDLALFKQQYMSNEGFGTSKKVMNMTTMEQVIEYANKSNGSCYAALFCNAAAKTKRSLGDCLGRIGGLTHDEKKVYSYTTLETDALKQTRQEIENKDHSISPYGIQMIMRPPA